MEGPMFDPVALAAAIDAGLVTLAQHRLGAVATVLALALLIAVFGVLPAKPAQR